MVNLVVCIVECGRRLFGRRLKSRQLLKKKVHPRENAGYAYAKSKTLLNSLNVDVGKSRH